MKTSNAIIFGLPLNTFLLLALIIYKTIGIYAQTNQWQIFNVSNSGLADNVVFHTAFQDPDISWIGTNNGLSRFDGASWTTYKMGNSGLPANIVKRLMVDLDGKLWIGTNGVFTVNGGGLAIFDGTKWEVYNPSNSPIPDNWVTSIVRDKQGNKWIGTDNGLVKYNGVNFTVLPSGFTTYYESISSLAIENDSVVLVGTGWGLSRFDGKGWAQFRIGNSGLPSDNIWDLYKDSLGITWIGTNSGGLAKVEGTEWTVYNTANSGMPVNDVISVAADKNHTVWIGTWNGGLASFSGEKWTIWNTSNSPLPSNIVYSVEIDHYGNKWIGTSAGLAIFNEDGIKGRNNLPENDIANTSSSIGRIYPNPVNGSAVVPVKIGSKGWVTLKLMTVCGQELLVLNDKKLHAGEHSFMLDATGLAKGLYLCVLTTADGIIAERFIIN